MKSKWKGMLTFDPAQAGPLSEKRVRCEFIFDQDDEGGITGSFLDGDYFDLTDQLIPVSGFIDDNFLSLVAVYPNRGVYDAQGEMTIRVDVTNHEMAIYGELNESADKITGNWEVVERTALDVDFIQVYYSGGFFEVEKID